MLLRIVNMRGVDLNTYDFDFDLTWAAFFMNADGYVYGRYGSREEGPAEAGLSLKGLKYALSEALQAYRARPRAKPVERIAAEASLPARPELYPSARRLKKENCIHCHQIYNFQHELFWSKKIWSKDRMWVYPPPKNVGLMPDVDQGDRLERVVAGSPAARAGLQPGDVLETLNGLRISSTADIQYALNRAPAEGRIPVVWRRNGTLRQGTLLLRRGWRKSDISWRASLWTVPPAAGIYGRDLSAAEKRRVGLSADRLAFRQGRYVPPKTRRAGIRGGDIIIGVDGKPLKMKMLQFNLYLRENYNVGDRVTINVIRNGRRLNIPMTLPLRPR